MNATPFRALAGALLLFLCGACSAPKSAPAAKAESAVAASLPGGTPMAVELAAPADGALVASPPGSVHVSGTVSVGVGDSSTDTTLVYLLDATAAAGASAECGDAATVLACEVAALAALTARVADLPTVGDVGAAIFGAGGAALDVAPDDGVQALAAPGADANAENGADVVEAIGSATADGKAGKFTAVDAGSGPAEVGSGLQAAFDVADASGRPARLVVILSASTNEAGPQPADLAVPDGVVIRAFALPGTTCAAGLADFAALGTAGSGCEDVSDLATLAGRVGAAADAALVSATISVDGDAGVPLAVGALPAASPFTATFEAVVTQLTPGVHDLCVTAAGTDAGGPGSAETCVSVTVAAIALSPETATNELGTPGQTATVTATVAAGDAGVAGVPVVFTIASGPNAGATETVDTDADGRASFTYVARQHLEGLGTDEITACFADAEENEACGGATVTWQDTTPPVVACVPGPNPGGQTVARQGGVSPSGFMRLVATDAVDPAPVVFLVDTGSGTTWGPFESGKAIKYTQAPGARPGAEEMGGEGGLEILHVKGTGDPAVRGEDAEENASAPLVCPVPPRKK